jgi:hypothetical protein
MTNRVQSPYDWRELVVVDILMVRSLEGRAGFIPAPFLGKVAPGDL